LRNTSKQKTSKTNNEKEPSLPELELPSFFNFK